jgi:hypothetical protein
MKRLVKRAMRAGWNATLPIRQPFVVRIEAFLRRCMAQSGDATIVLDHVVRELLRLQEQMDTLQATLDEMRAEREMLTIVRPIDHDRMKAG